MHVDLDSSGQTDTRTVDGSSCLGHTKQTDADYCQLILLEKRRRVDTTSTAPHEV